MNIPNPITAAQAREAAMTDGLLPCPFCGAPAKYRDFSRHDPEKPEPECHHIRCSDSKCRGYASYGFTTKAIAIAAWNTRASRIPPRLLPALAKVVEALEMELEEIRREVPRRAEARERQIKAALASLAVALKGEG